MLAFRILHVIGVIAWIGGGTVAALAMALHQPDAGLGALHVEEREALVLRAMRHDRDGRLHARGARPEPQPQRLLAAVAPDAQRARVQVRRCPDLPLVRLTDRSESRLAACREDGERAGGVVIADADEVAVAGLAGGVARDDRRQPHVPRVPELRDDSRLQLRALLRALGRAPR